MMNTTHLLLSLLAGMLSTLSPCVLPLIPIIIGGSLSTHRAGPWLIAAGLTCAFTLIGILLASIGSSLGLSQESFRWTGSMVMMVFGVILLSGGLQARFSSGLGGLSQWGNVLLERMSGQSLAGQFSLGLLLGLVWTPCIGPVMGATLALASQGGHFTQVALSMLLFGLGAGIPLVLLGYTSRSTLNRTRGKLMATGQWGKKGLGLLLLVLGIFMLTGIDKVIENMLLDISPEWWTALTTRY
jgi:cytochrome c biogenesis protein CcdA